MLILFFHYSKPTIKINNKTHGDVFVFFGTSEKDVDPDFEQIKQSWQALKISQGKSIEVSISILDYFLRNGQVNVGWRVGGLAGTAIKRVGYNTFNIVSGSKHCSLGIDIYSDKDETFYQGNALCIKFFEITSSEDN